MDYKSILLKLLFSLSLLSILTACGGPNEDVTIGTIKVSPEPLSLIGRPPSTLFYDVQFEFEFGAAGGDGEYRYRYIQNPVTNTGEQINVAPNPVEMSIEVPDSAKPIFRLKALPQLPEDVNFQELSDRKFTYQIELTDGKNTITRDFEFTLRKNKLQLVTLSIAQEGTANTLLATNLLNQLKSGQTRVCKQITERTFEKTVTDQGETVYPYVFQVFAEANVASRTELFYRFRSNYSESDLERSNRNIGFLRPGVDFIDKDRSIVLEPGNATCVGFIEMLDDKIIEGNEEVRLEFFNRVGGAVDTVGAAGVLEVRDNELLPEYETTSVLRNRGDKVVVPIKLRASSSEPVSIGVSVDSAKTTADPADYVLQPASGVVTFNENERESSYTVSVSAQADSNIASSYEDKKIYINTEIDKVIDVEPFMVEINEWPKNNSLSNEIVARDVDNDEAVSFALDADGILTALIAHTGNTNIRTRLKAFYRDATVFKMTDQQNELEFGKTGIDVIPKAIATQTEGGDHTIAVVANVNGLYGDIHRGGIDFVVIKLTRSRDGLYVLNSVKQYGTDGDDNVSSIIIRNKVIYIYGKTDGQNFEGQATNETNNGGEDGFIYAIDLATNSYSWARFLGTSDNDIVKSIDVGNRDIVALISTFNNDEDAFVKKLFSRTSLDQEMELPVSFASPRDDKAVAIRFNGTANTYRALLNSSALLSETNSQTPTLSEDAQLAGYDSEDLTTDFFSIATSGKDESVAFEYLPGNKHFVVAGHTDGVFENNQKKGTTGRDAFVSIFESELNRTQELNTLQFGTPGDDQVISIRPVSTTKFLVLWKENFTQTPAYVYRISAFSVDGRKLSRDPD